MSIRKPVRIEKLVVMVKTRSKRPGVTKQDDGTYLVRVTAAPIDGAANEAVRRLLADHFGIARSALTLIRGPRSTRKIWHRAQ